MACEVDIWWRRDEWVGQKSMTRTSGAESAGTRHAKKGEACCDRLRVLQIVTFVKY